jgi:O-methyltransferase
MNYTIEPWKTKDVDTKFIDHFNSLLNSGLDVVEKNIDELKMWPPNERYYITWKAAEHVSSLDGDFVECGVFKGEQAFYMAKECKTKLHLFDSWQGAENVGQYDNDFYIKNSFKCSIDDAKITMSEFSNVEFYSGHVPFGFDKVESISLLSIDLDLYEPTKISLENLWPKVVDGGIALIDFHDGVSAGAEKATRDYFKDRKYEIKVLPTGKCMVIKQ